MRTQIREVITGLYGAYRKHPLFPKSRDQKVKRNLHDAIYDEQAYETEKLRAQAYEDAIAES